MTLSGNAESSVSENIYNVLLNVAGGLTITILLPFVLAYLFLFDYGTSE